MVFRIRDALGFCEMKKSVKYSRILFRLSACLLLMMLCSGFTSPLYPQYTGHDSSIFLIIAKGITKGKIPYRDLYDHKGPVFFWMEAAGYYLGGRTGVFIFQCLLLLCDLFFIDRIISLFHADRPTVILSFFSAFFFLFQHGNLTEEFSMPLLLAGMYYQLRYLLSKEDTHAPGTAFFYGIIIGLLAFIRLNNAMVVCALLVCIAVLLIRKRLWINLLGNLVMGVLGLMAIAGPVCFYYYRRGSLYDMIYGTFLHNLIYTKNNTHYPILSSSFLYFVCLLLPGVFAFGIFFTKWRLERNRAYASLMFAAAATYGMLAYTNVYMHYYMLGIPLLTAAAAAMGERQPFNEIRKKMTAFFLHKEVDGKARPGFAWALLTCMIAFHILLSVVSAFIPFYKTYLTDIACHEYTLVRESISVIPEEERDEVIGYNIQANFYYHADIVPCYKYFTFQKWMSTDKVNVNQEFMNYLTEEHPLWVVIPVEENKGSIHEILTAGYACKKSNGIYACYRYLDT